MWQTCPKCGENVYLEGENVRDKVSYSGICPKCGKLIINDVPCRKK